MADNTTLNLGTGGDVIATDDIGGVKHQLVKVEFGAADSATPVSAANPLPVTVGNFPASQAVTGTFYQATQPVSAASLPLPAGAATETTVAAINSTLTAGTVQLAAGAAVGATPSTRAVQVSGSDYAGTPLSRAIKVDANGAQYIGNFPATQAVSGTFWQTTQPVSLATNTPDVTDRAGRLLGSIANTSFAVTNTGTFAVQAAATLAAETTKVIGTVNIAAAQTLATVSAVTAITNALPTGANTIGAVTGPAAAPLALDASLTGHAQTLKAATLVVTTLSTANTTVTATLPAVAAQFHYITRIRITMHNTSAAAVAGSALALAFTSTNLPGSLAWTEGNALAAGTSKVVVDEVLSQPLKSSVLNTATTIVAPACGAGVQVRISVYYYTAV